MRRRHGRCRRWWRRKSLELVGLIQFIEPKKGTYKKLIVRDGRLVGGILMGDISKAAYLMRAFDRDAPLPEDRLALLFDIGTPDHAVTIAEMPADHQVCNCNGVTKAAIGVRHIRNDERDGGHEDNARRHGLRLMQEGRGRTR